MIDCDAPKINTGRPGPDRPDRPGTVNGLDAAALQRLRHAVARDLLRERRRQESERRRAAGTPYHRQGHNNVAATAEEQLARVFGPRPDVEAEGLLLRLLDLLAARPDLAAVLRRTLIESARRAS